MEIKTKKVDNINIIYPPERLDIDASFDLKEIIDNIIKNESDTHILLNLEEVEYINSSSLGEILKVIRVFKGSGRVIQICNIYNNVKEIIKIVNLANVIDIFESENEALESIKKLTS
ncbi:MAG: STAS domain-containing protein [bacterium]|nr:STAS domain-containing protein [bacterium]